MKRTAIFSPLDCGASSYEATNDHSVFIGTARGGGSHDFKMTASIVSESAAENRARTSRGISGGEQHYEWAVNGLEKSIRASDAILDLGCGVGLFGTFLKERFGRKAHGVDVVRHEGFREEDYVSFELKDLEALLQMERRFDFIFAIGLLEHLPNPRTLIATLPVLLAPGGKAVITAPNPASLRNTVALVVRGEFAAFRESSNPASITPILPVDACRMFREAGFREVALDYSGRGRPPGARGVQYRDVLPFLRGRLWSDDFRVVATKEE